jgi:hypothetical protein
MPNGGQPEIPGTYVAVPITEKRKSKKRRKNREIETSNSSPQPIRNPLDYPPAWQINKHEVRSLTTKGFFVDEVVRVREPALSGIILNSWPKF